MASALDGQSTEASLESILPPELAAALASRKSEIATQQSTPPEAPAAPAVPSAVARPAAEASVETVASVSDTAPTVASEHAFPPPPPEPATLAEAGLSEGMVDGLLLKILLHEATATGAQLARHSCLSRTIVGETLSRFRDDLLVTIKGQADGNDYVFQLTEAGHARAKQHSDHANYADAAPVPLAAYERAIRAQAIGQTKMSVADLRGAFEGLTLGDALLSLVAQAVSDGRGMFLYGYPGNGKTTIAERLCGAFGKHLWIPRAVSVGSDLLRVFDASCHEPVEAPELETLRYDRRWVLIKRPTVVVGGELTLEQLDPCYNPASGVSEAPVQMKANGGALVIDDFGRQRVSSTDLLNRLIVPLEKQFDYLSLASGRQARIPFEMLFVLSTNLEPRELVDEAFLRRIPYKIEVNDPTLEQFHELFGLFAKQIGMQVAPGVVDELIKNCYEPTGRPMRFCHPRDLLRQAKNYCVVHDRPLVADAESLAAATNNYFAGL